MRVYLYWTTCLFEFLICTAARGQPIPFQQPDNQAYAHDDQLAYKKLQALLLPILDNPAYITDERYQAAVRLSYTYKQPGDYASTQQYRQTAGQLTAKTSYPDSNAARIRAQQAFG